MCRKPLRISLIRHGRSAHAQTGWLTAAGFAAWRRAYEASGVRDNEQPPARLCRLGEEAAAIVASDAPRAVESAHLMAPERPVIRSPLLRELQLEHPGFWGLHLPLPLWALAVGTQTGMLAFLGRHPSPAERGRVAQAADWLADLATCEGDLAVVTHASFRRRLADQLQTLGWRFAAPDRSWNHWSIWPLEWHADK